MRALLPLLRASGGTWVGWTGEADDAPEPFDLDGVELHPVLVTADEVQDYYEGFSNDTLWPLYHDALRDSTYSGAALGRPTRRVNQRFADTLAEVAPDERDRVDPRLPPAARARRCCATSGRDLVIGFFFHIPFPPVELFMRLPWRTEIAAGLAGCDLVGFQRAINAANFVASCATSCSWRQRAQVGCVPDLDRRRGARGASPPAGPPASAPTATAPASASPRSCCSASTASTTRRASASACGRTSRCSTTARSTPSAA